MTAVARHVVRFGMVLLPLIVGGQIWAQTSGATVSGTVTSGTGTAIPGATVVIKNLNSGQSVTVQAGSAGRYSISNLSAGEYKATISADGFAPKELEITLEDGHPWVANAVLSPPAAGSETTNLPNAPSSSKTEPSMEDLGFSKEQVQGNAREQALLDKRTHMLKIHQRLGLITTAPLIAAVATSIGAGGKHTSNTDRTVHMVLGSTSADLYFMTAWYAIRAPRVPGTETRGPIRFHKAMAWIHGPGMILTPILGAIAYSQKNNGEKVHGIAVAHGPVAIVTAGAFGAALLSVSTKF